MEGDTPSGGKARACIGPDRNPMKTKVERRLGREAQKAILATFLGAEFAQGRRMGSTCESQRHPGKTAGRAYNIEGLRSHRAPLGKSALT